ncbi:hypothetical protein XnspCFBP7698_10575 [Xanthomonas sp. CFBP 7698]|nr:hypothetical protein XnspCFBP7698_10575 [Xanthomonas sp. CFBP 7698]
MEYAWLVPASLFQCSTSKRWVGRGRGALTARGTRRESVRGGSVAASMPPHGPAIREGTAPDSVLATSLKDESTAPDSWLMVLLKSEESTPRDLPIAYQSAAHQLNTAHRPSPLVLARPPSRDPWRHGCRHGAYMDVLAACPAMVGGQGPCSKMQS